MKSIMKILDTIGSCGTNKLNKCSDHDCYVKLRGIRKHVIFKGEELVCEKLGKKKKACDCVIFTVKYGILIVSLVELKSLTIDYGAVQEKFDNTVMAAKLVLNRCCITKNFQINLILLTKSYYKPSNNPRARGFKPKITDKNKFFYDQCGTQLNDLIKRRREPRRKK